MLRIHKEQKQRLAGKRGGRAVAPCPKYDGFFAVVKVASEAPAKGVRYRIRRASGAVIEGVTDDKGFTQVVETKRPEVLRLEIVDDVQIVPVTEIPEER